MQFSDQPETIQKFEEDMKYVNSKLKNIDTKLSSIHPTNNAYVSKLKDTSNVSCSNHLKDEETEKKIEDLSNSTDKNSPRFPLNDNKKLQLWLKAIGRKGFAPNAGSRLCSDHFTQSDFYENPGGSYKLTLKTDAIPSVFQLSVHSTLLPTKLFSSEPQKKKCNTYNFRQANK